MLFHKYCSDLQDGAWSHCTEFCTDLVTNDYAEGWEVVFELLKKTKIQDPFTGKLLWCFCAVHAPSRFLNELFELRLVKKRKRKVKRCDWFIYKPLQHCRKI